MCSGGDNYVLDLGLEWVVQSFLMIFYIAILKTTGIVGWWDVFTFWKSGHVLVFWEVADSDENFRFTQSLEYILGRVMVALYLIPPEEWIDQLAETGRVVEVIEWGIDKIESFHYNLRGLMTCTSVIKAVIGVNAPFVLNPQQLSRELLSRGGKLVWVEEVQQGQRKPD